MWTCILSSVQKEWGGSDSMLMFGLNFIFALVFKFQLFAVIWFNLLAQKWPSLIFQSIIHHIFLLKYYLWQCWLLEVVTQEKKIINNRRERMLSFSSPFSPLLLSTYVHPTSVQVRTRFPNKRQLFVEKVLKLLSTIVCISSISLCPLFPSRLLFFVHPHTHFPLLVPLLLLFCLCLCDVGYGIADFQTAPVDSSCHGEQSQQHHQHPRDVDPLGVLSRLPRAHLNTKTSKSRF